MIIRRVSILTGKYTEMELPITDEQFDDYLSGTLIQRAMPHLTPTQREFIISGMDEEEQERFFGREEE
jgi:hypothetical protein